MFSQQIKEKLPEDTDLVQRFRAGDENAFNTLHQQYFLPVYYYTFKYIKNEQESKDIVSETFGKLWLLKKNFNSLPDIRGFLYTVSYNEACDYLKYQYRTKKEILTDDVQKLIGQDIADQDINSRIAQAELLHDIYREIKKLPPQRQQVLTLFFVQGLTTAEVAKKLGMEEAVVRSVKAQALSQLRTKLGPLQLSLLALALLQLPQLTQAEILN